jgi:hypothetical protein
MKITVFLYMNEIENYDYRIEHNLIVNKGRWQRFRKTVIALLILPVLLGISYILLDGCVLNKPIFFLPG